MPKITVVREEVNFLRSQIWNFSVPDSDEMWNASSDERGSILRNMTLQHTFRDNHDTSGWISQASVQLHDAWVILIGFDNAQFSSFTTWKWLHQ